jgi:hypothetical protein
VSVIKTMKKRILIITAAVALASAGNLLAQDAVQTTSVTTSAGTISDFDPQAIVVRTDAAPEPVRYTYTKTTTYVDENGNPVSIETVKSGLPVVVYYTREGDELVASKVVVKTTAVPPQPVQPIEPVQPPDTTVKQTRTTTTTTEDR